MDIFAKAASLGLQTEFIDGQGHRHVTDAAALQIILDALPIEAPHRFLSEPVVVRSGLPSRTALGRRAELPVQWKIVAGSNMVAIGTTGDGIITWPTDLPDGSYRLQLTDASSFTEEVPLIVASPRALGGDFDRG